MKRFSTPPLELKGTQIRTGEDCVKAIKGILENAGFDNISIESPVSFVCTKDEIKIFTLKDNGKAYIDFSGYDGIVWSEALEFYNRLGFIMVICKRLEEVMAIAIRKNLFVV